MNDVDGALSAAVGGTDGLLIEQYPEGRELPMDLSMAVAELTNLIANGRLVSRALSGGGVEELVLFSQQLVSYTRLLNSELFFLVVMTPNGNVGQARLRSERAAERVLEAFV